MKVKATAAGYYTTLRAEGDVFEIEDTSHLGSWMEPQEEKKPKRKPAARKKAAPKESVEDFLA